MKNRYGNTYSFLYHFAYLALSILIGKFITYINKEITNELQADIGD